MRELGRTCFVYANILLRSSLTRRLLARSHRLAEEKRLADIAAAKAAAEEARRNAVYVDEPMKSKLYVSETMESTVEEVKELNINHERPLLSLSIGRNLSSCGQKLQLGDRDHDQTGIVEWQKTRFPEFDMNRMERDIGIQAAPEVGEGENGRLSRGSTQLCSNDVSLLPPPQKAPHRRSGIGPSIWPRNTRP